MCTAVIHVRMSINIQIYWDLKNLSAKRIVIVEDGKNLRYFSRIYNISPEFFSSECIYDILPFYKEKLNLYL